MESWSVAHKNLQIFCADVWDTAERCQLILDEIGISSGRISLSEPSIMRWYRIILELMRRNDGSMTQLVQALMKDYPGNSALAVVCAPWTPSAPAKSLPIPEPIPAPLVDSPVPPGAVLVKKFRDEPEPKAVPVVAPADFADEAELVIPRLDTLWEAMVDMERRMVEMEQWRSLPKPARK